MGDNEDSLKTLLGMGFTEDASKEALAKFDGNAEQALNSLLQTETDANEAKANGPKSYRCTDTGKVFRTMRDAQLYAERTGNQNFEEIDALPPMTEEEKLEQKKKLQALIKEKRQARELSEAADEKERVLKLRKEGQQHMEMMEEVEKEQNKRYAELKKAEKKAAKKHKNEILEQIAKDKADRIADEARKRGEDPKAAYDAAYEKYRPKPPGKEVTMAKAIDVLKFEDKATDKSGAKKSLSLLQKIIDNIIKDPEEEKFRKLKRSGKMFSNRVGKYRGAMKFLEICGFAELSEEDEVYSYLSTEAMDLKVLQLAASILEKELDGL